MNKGKERITWLIVALFTVAAGCNTQRKIIREPLKDDKGADYLFAQLKKNEFTFKYLNIRFSADASLNNKDNSMNGSLRMVKDSAIWISLSPALGIEAARVLITPDSIKFLNRLESTYFAEEFKYINSLMKTNMDFDMLQSLIVGNDFSSYENDVFKATVDGNEYLLSTIGRGKLKKYIKNQEDSLHLIVQDIWLNPENYKINKVRLKELRENRKLDAEYISYTKVDTLLFPEQVKYTCSNEKTKIEIKLQNTKISTTGPLDMPFNITAKYQRIK